MKNIDGIRFKFTAGFFCIVAAVMTLLITVSYRYETQAIRQRVYAQLNAIADLKKELVVKYLDERRDDLKIIAADASVRARVALLRDPATPASARQAALRALTRRLQLVQNISLGYQGLEIDSDDGSVLVSTDKRERRGSPTGHGYRPALHAYLPALASGATLFLHEDGHLDIVRRIADDAGRTSAIVVGSIDLTDTLFPLFSDFSGLGRTGETLLVRGDADRVAFASPTRFPLPQDFGRISLEGRSLLLSRLAVAGNEGIDAGTDYRGKEVIGAYRYLPMLRWGIVAKIDTNEAFSGITALRRRVALLAIVILLATLALVLIVVGRFSSPVVELIEKTKAVAAGRYATIARSGRRDELGVLEENFNRMVLALDEARRRADLRQEDLENRVRERTEHLARANAALSTALADIERESAEKKVLQAQLLHAQKMEAVGTLAGGIAHDFNNILTAIIGYGNVMQMKLPAGDPVREHLDHILAAAERAANLTHSLLAFSRKQIIRPGPVTVNSVVQRIEKLLVRLMGEDIEFRSVLSPDDPVVMADAGQLEQVLMNLATNARDAMPNGGSLLVETTIVDRGAQADAEGRSAVISVTDTGEGMDEATRRRIFDPFYTTKETGKGTGLGLAIVYGIVEQHDGSITCESEPGRGTTFRIFLPLIRAAAGEGPATGCPEPQRGSETILVAEDNPEVRRLVTTVLTDYGYTVIEAVDGVDAVQKFRARAEDVDLLLLDVVMPRKTGRDAYDEIRKIRPNVKTIFTSGYTADHIRQRGIADKDFLLLTKPLAPADLLTQIRAVLDRPAAASDEGRS